MVTKPSPRPKIIEGPKGCGKTAIARQFARSEVLLDVDENARRAIAIDPSLVLDGPVPRGGREGGWRQPCATLTSAYCTTVY